MRTTIGLVFGAILLASACSATSPVDATTAPEPDAGAASDGGSDARSSRRGGDGGIAEIPDEPDASFEACATDTIHASAVPLDLYVMLDSSGSMQDVTSAGTSKWTAVRNALSLFFGDAKSAGVSVALQFFPIPSPGVPTRCTSGAQCGAYGPCTKRACLQAGAMTYCDTDADCTGGPCVDYGVCDDGSSICVPSIGADCKTGAACNMVVSGECMQADSCNVGAYATPATALAALPGAAGALDGVIAAHALRGLTPTGPALAGAIQGARTLAANAPSHAVATLFVTDGLPTTCTPETPSAIAVAAADGLNDGIRTYVIGVFAPAEATEAQANLDVVAHAGGTSKAFIVSTSSNVASDLETALTAIRGSAMACEYQIPKPKSGTLDFDEVNVSASLGSKSATWSRVGADSQCGTSRAWHYDTDPAKATPNAIVLCPAACDAVKGDSSARVDVVLGCASVLK